MGKRKGVRLAAPAMFDFVSAEALDGLIRACAAALPLP